MHKKYQTILTVLAIAWAIVGTASSASAAGFALIEQSASGMGNAFAGAAATAEDPSTIFYNPAGMSKLQGMQVTIGAHAIDLSAKLSNSGSSISLGAQAIGSQPGGDGGDAGGVAFVPNLYFVMPIGDRFNFGIGINAPFGLVTEYDDNWIGRFQGIKSELKTYNINPALSFKVNDTFAIGAGVNYQHLDAKQRRAVLIPVPPAAVEGRAEVGGGGDAWGWHIGVLPRRAPSTKMGTP